MTQAEDIWKLPERELWRAITLPEEDLPSGNRGGYYRWFRSENVIDLVPLIRDRARPPKPPCKST
jgi:hypothetical protein